MMPIDMPPKVKLGGDIKINEVACLICGKKGVMKLIKQTRFTVVVECKNCGTLMTVRALR